MTALLAAAGGGIGLEVLRRFFVPAQSRFDDGVTQRQELRKDIDTLQVQVGALMKDVSDWQLKYYDLRAENAALRAANAEMSGRIQILEFELDRLGHPLPKRAGRRGTDPLVEEGT